MVPAEQSDVVNPVSLAIGAVRNGIGRWRGQRRNAGRCSAF